MLRLIEGAHYRRREEQPTHAPPKSKEAVDCLLCSDPGDDKLEHVARKRSRPIVQNLRLDRFHAHLKSHHQDACRNGASSLLTMGFSRRAPSVAAAAPPEGGVAQEIVASGSLRQHAPSPTEIDPHVGTSASGSLGTVP